LERGFQYRKSDNSISRNERKKLKNHLQGEGSRKGGRGDGYQRLAGLNPVAITKQVGAAAME